MSERATSLKTLHVQLHTQVDHQRGLLQPRQRARAEVATACVSYVEEEISLKLKKAKLEASIEMLNYKKETAAAKAEAEASRCKW